ncbi:MAG TPA: 50S ribosomal protein L18 [Candidatus Goldiibacteriota bacterium]|nr:50S ribosomal protein L18 [Candidatus Goldiibacteriota bacterium]
MKIRKATNKIRVKRIIRKERGRKKISGTAEKPRLSFFRGSRALFAQAIDDMAGRTIVGVATNSKELREKAKNANKAAAKELAIVFAAKCREKGIQKVVFDRSGFKFHGIVKTFADTVRENGIVF